MWKTAERSEEFSKPCENPRVGNPEQICKALNGFAQGGSFHGIVTLIVLGRKGPHWIPFQAAALALSHTLNASFRNRLNVSLLHK